MRSRGYEMVEVERSCGHPEEVKVFEDAPAKKREDYLWGQSQMLCRDCWKAEKRKEDEERAEREGLPPLKGSRKQIAWATSLRLKLLDEIEGFLQRTHDSLDLEDDDQVRRFRPLVEAQDRLRAKVEAKFWIDNREESGDSMLRKIAQGRLET